MNASNKDFEYERIRLRKILETLSDPLKKKEYDKRIGIE